MLVFATCISRYSPQVSVILAQTGSHDRLPKLIEKAHSILIIFVNYAKEGMAGFHGFQMSSDSQSAARQVPDVARGSPHPKGPLKDGPLDRGKVAW